MAELSKEQLHLFEKWEREAREEEELGREHLRRAQNIRWELKRMRTEAYRQALEARHD